MGRGAMKQALAKRAALFLSGSAPVGYLPPSHGAEVAIVAYAARR
jgi:hypothetical protein